VLDANDRPNLIEEFLRGHCSGLSFLKRNLSGTIDAGWATPDKTTKSVLAARIRRLVPSWMAVDSFMGIIRLEVRMKYKVLLKESEEGFSVSCPGLPGCWSQGATEEEALENIQDAIAEYLSAIDELVKGQDVREVRVAV
jgi:predicted RNase H-like HicB family nuclease